MISIQGVGVSPGLACGPLYFHRPAENVIRRTAAPDRRAKSCIPQLRNAAFLSGHADSCQQVPTGTVLAVTFLC